MSKKEKNLYQLLVARMNQRQVGAYPFMIITLVLVAMSFWSVNLWDDNQALSKQLDIANRGLRQYNADGTVAAATSSPTAEVDRTAVKGTPIPLSASDHYVGSLDALVSLITYTDFECPFCETFHATLAEIKEAYGDQVVMAYRHYPLSFHKNATKKAEAAECVAELGGSKAFGAFADILFAETEALDSTVDKLGAAAVRAGVGEKEFASCFNAGKYAQVVQDSLQDGVNVGVSGTPGTIVLGKNGQAKLIPGAYPLAKAKSIIDEVLAAN